MQHPEETCYEF